MGLNLGFLASGGGSNVEAILDSIDSGFLDAKAKVIISNNPGAGVLEIARKRGIPDYCLNSKRLEGYDSLDSAIVGVFREHGVDLVVSAGYVRPVGDMVLEEFLIGFLIFIRRCCRSMEGRGCMVGMFMKRFWRRGIE